MCNLLSKKCWIFHPPLLLLLRDFKAMDLFKPNVDKLSTRLILQLQNVNVICTRSLFTECALKQLVVRTAEL